MKRTIEVVGTYSTCEASPNTAAATARHTSTSIPSQTPASLGAPKPARPVLEPHISFPLSFTKSRVLPWLPAIAVETPRVKRRETNKDLIFVIIFLLIIISFCNIDYSLADMKLNSH